MNLPYNLYSRSWLGTGNNELYKKLIEYVKKGNDTSILNHYGEEIDTLGCNNKYNCIIE